MCTDWRQEIKTTIKQQKKLKLRNINPTKISCNTQNCHRNVCLRAFYELMSVYIN